ncbi:glycosyltransferase family 39 protein [Desulforhopalus vacuolatus]|uniref:glycosyltransferase family 39 protein n=1 Tax=Desulforhopalus vacuolatus TaxID=40414 RepID=UPI001965A681|nr:glycosyltransferase family 39 protein [Desulforhopalus vacuolatus]MBM9519513.1 glycosyltransferase family 39 protein [Desulforhopalus vacuolatus]
MIKTTENKRNDKIYLIIIAAVSFVFFLKALYLSFFVTPLWAIPDEMGHLAYVYDIAQGRGVPLLHTAKIDSNIMSHFKGTANAAPVGNWIAQHPPVYYMLAAIPLKIAMVFTDNNEILFRIPRIISSLSGSLVIVVLFFIFQLINLAGYKSVLLSSAISFTPMFTHLSSGTNHDMTLFLFSAISIYYLVKFIKKDKPKYLYLMGLWLTLASGIKMTEWVALVPLLVFICIYLFYKDKKNITHILGVVVLTLSVPILWMSRNFYYFHNPFFTDATPNSFRLSDNPLKDNFFDFLSLQPAIEHFIIHFYGLIGGHHVNANGHALLQVSGNPLFFFSIVFFTISTLLVIVILKNSFGALKNNTKPNAVNITLLLVIIFSVLASISLFLANKECYNILFIISTAFLIFSGITAFPLIFYSKSSDDLLFHLGLITFLFFTTILLYEVYNIYLLDGRMRAIQGRYFYPVIPLLLLSIAIAIKKMNIPLSLLILFSAGLVVMELETCVLQTLPFYWSMK